MNRSTFKAMPAFTDFLVGGMLMGMLVIALVVAFTHAVPSYIAGIPVWIAVCLRLGSLQKNQRIQSGALFFFGSLGLIIGAINGADKTHFLKAIEANQLLVAMIVSISFLRIVAAQNINSDESLPSGKRAMVTTLLGSHLISAVINLSSVMIVGDRLSDKKTLSAIQGLVLLRAFSIAALWSPFFAAMGVVLISAPGSQLITLVVFGLPTAVAALLLTVLQTLKYPKIENTNGYPLHFSALWMPLLLALLVFIEHSLWPEISVITFVTVTSILFVLCYLVVKLKKKSVLIIKEHVSVGLPKLSGEITLFLSAAVMAAGIAASLQSLDIRLAPEHFTAFEATLTLLVVVGLAMVGMHPVTTAILAGGILMPSVSDPNLLGITLLLGWSIGVGVSPFSGVQLSIQSRFGISALELLKLNWLYSILILSVGIAVIWTYATIVGL